MPTRHEDLNQSSRLDLDYDAEGDFDESNASPRLQQIAESQSFSSRSNCSNTASTSSVESTVMGEGGIDASSSNGLNNMGGGGEVQRRIQEEENHPYQEVNSFGRNGRKNIQREGTYSTLDTSSSPKSRNDGEGTSKKLVKIKMWDPGESMAQPSVVTVAMDMRTNQELGTMHDFRLGVGQKIELLQKRSSSGGGERNRTDDEEKTVDVTWKPQLRLIEESWQPPLRISTGDEEQSRSSRVSDTRRSQPQSILPERHSSVTTTNSSIPNTHTSAPISTSVEGKADMSKEDETIRTPVKGLEPFTIPAILSSTIIKRTPAEKVGLAFRKAAGTVVIEKIVPGSAFDGTALRPGYECLCINGHRLRSARRAAEIVRESGSSLSLMASNAPRPPGTMYTMISLQGDYEAGRDYAMGMHFKMKHGLVQLAKANADSPIGSSSMSVGDFALAINGLAVGNISKAVEVLIDSNDDMVPILYFNMRQLRRSLVDKVIGDVWKKEWSDAYDECLVLQPGSGSSKPLAIRFKEEGMLCELLDPLRTLRDKSSGNEESLVPPEHPLNSVVETLNHGIICVLAAIREGIELATNPRGGSSSQGSNIDVARNGEKQPENGSSGGGLIGELAKLSEMYKEGLLSKDDFEAIKSKLLKS